MITGHYRRADALVTEVNHAHACCCWVEDMRRRSLGGGRLGECAGLWWRSGRRERRKQAADFTLC